MKPSGATVHKAGAYSAVEELRMFWVEVLPHAYNCVKSSFYHARVIGAVTDTEVEHRVNIVKRLIDQMRNDLKWSKTRIKDSILPLLIHSLTGQGQSLEQLAKKNRW